MEQIANLLPLLLVVAVFYLLVLRPARTRQRQALQLQASLAPGQRVLTTTGLHGTVRRVDDDAVELEIAPGVTTRWAKSAIGRVVDPAAAAGTAGTPVAAADRPGDGSGSAPPVSPGSSSTPSGASVLRADGPEASGPPAAHP